MICNVHVEASCWPAANNFLQQFTAQYSHNNTAIIILEQHSQPGEGKHACRCTVNLSVKLGEDSHSHAMHQKRK